MNRERSDRLTAMNENMNLIFGTICRVRNLKIVGHCSRPLSIRLAHRESQRSTKLRIESFSFSRNFSRARQQCHYGVLLVQ